MKKSLLEVAHEMAANLYVKLMVLILVIHESFQSDSSVIEYEILFTNGAKHPNYFKVRKYV
jgi:hypothetical protein